jgi:uncharacterized cupin superfamily protein
MLEKVREKSLDASHNHEKLDVLGTSLSVFANGTTVPFVVGELLVPPGLGAPTHVHEADDEFFYVLEGEVLVIGREAESTAGMGACVQLPRDIPHGFRNATDAPARILVVLSPGHQALEMFRHFDRAGRQAPLGPEAIVAIAGQYGVRFV